MKWEKTDYRVIKEGNVSFYHVPSEGGTYTFTCKNYKGFWLADTWFEQDGRKWFFWEEMMQQPGFERDWKHYGNDWIEITVNEGGVLEVVFQPNTGTTRKADVGVTAGDIFDTFHFVQSAGE